MANTFLEAVTSLNREKLSEGLLKVAGYDNSPIAQSRKISGCVLYFGALAVCTGSSVVWLYKRGVFKKVTPNCVAEKIDDIAAAMAPPNQTKGTIETLKHLRITYAETFKKLISAYAGTYLFFKAPHIPLPLVLMGVGATALTVVLVPKDSINPRSRRLMGFGAAFCTGYAFGPINWLMYDFNIHLGIAAAASALGFSMAANNARGLPAFLVGAPALASSSAIIASNLIMRNACAEKSSVSAVNTICQDANAALSLQLIANSLLLVCHAVPSWLRCRRAERLKAGKEEKTDDTTSSIEKFFSNLLDASGVGDPEVESLAIFGCVIYVTWYAFRKTASLAAQKIITESRKDDKSKLSAQERMLQYAKRVEWCDRIGGVTGTLTFFILYLKFVSYCQNRDTAYLLEATRKLFSLVSPIQLL